MIAFNKHCSSSRADWQVGFVEILPEIKQRLGWAFSRLDPEAQDDAVADGVVHCLLAYARLHEQGRTAAASPSSLAWYAALQIRRGRQAGCRLNSREPLARYAQLHNGIRAERRQGSDESDASWIDEIVADRRASVPDQVAARLDFSAWFAILPKRLAAIAGDLACGYSTAETARKFRVTAGRISQLRRTLEQSWRAFQSEPAPAAARRR